jgi:LPS sulfotransferase NodH
VPSALSAMTQAHKSYLICTNYRSGSWLIAETLQACGIGRPHEFFCQHKEAKLLSRLGIAEQSQYFDRIIAEGTSEKGVFGAKLHWDQLSNLLKHASDHLQSQDQCADRLLAQVFPNLAYIFLIRRDKLRQAISYHKALQTDLWWSFAGSRKNLPKGVATFDFQAIDAFVKRFDLEDLKWQYFFTKNHIKPLTLVYEDVVQDLQGAVNQVVDYLQVPLDTEFALPPPRLEKQADAVTEEWVREYLAINQGQSAK